jgi:hypothetical protein
MKYRPRSSTIRSALIGAAGGLLTHEGVGLAAGAVLGIVGEFAAAHLYHGWRRPLAWLRSSAAAGAAVGVLAGWRQGGFEGAVVAAFVGVVIASVIGCAAGAMVLLVSVARPTSRRGGPGPPRRLPVASWLPSADRSAELGR